MAVVTTIPTPPAPRQPPPLQNGDHLTRDEFELRYEAMPQLKKAELIEGVVFMPSPVKIADHGKQHGRLITWLGVYEAATSGVEMADNATVRLDWDNDPQPDGLLRVLPEYGGQSHTSADGYLEDAPELAAEVAASSVNYDLHEKFDAYRRNNVREYVVWRVLDKAIDWFILRQGEYQRLSASADLYKSEVFPGLWLDAAALLRGEMAKVLEVVQQGIASAEHREFVARLGAMRKST